LIELHAGHNESKALKPYSYIQPGRSVTDQITGRAEVIADKAEAVLNNIGALTDTQNREKLILLADNTNRALSELYDILNKNNETFTTTLANAELVTVELKETVALAHRTMLNLRGISRSDSIRTIIGNISTFSENLKEVDFVRMFQELNKTLDRTNNMIEQLDESFSKSNADIVTTISTLREAVDNLNQFSRLISEDPSILIRGAKPKDVPDYQLER